MFSVFFPSESGIFAYKDFTSSDTRHKLSGTEEKLKLLIFHNFKFNIFLKWSSGEVSDDHKRNMWNMKSWKIISFNFSSSEYIYALTRKLLRTLGLPHFNIYLHIFVKLILSLGNVILYLTKSSTTLQKIQFISDKDKPPWIKSLIS